MIIEAEELADRLGTPNLRILDVRWYLDDPNRGHREFTSGHVPTAVFCDLETDLTGSSGPGRHPLPRAEEFTSTLRRLGVDRNSLVVAYDDAGGAIAARAWWMLRSIGHEQAAVLNGGFRAWADSGLPVTQTTPRLKPGSYPTILEWTGVVGQQEVAAHGGDLIDARSPDRYRGDHEPIDSQAGHIPGATNLPYAGNLGPDGRFLPVEQLRLRFRDIADHPVVYCGSGVTACHDLLALSLIGRHGLLYEGSWSDWSRNTDAPVATGEQP